VARLDVGEIGPAKHLTVGDRFVLVSGRDNREHEITADHGSHFEYDGRPNKMLSKDEPVRRAGKHDVGERTDRVVSQLEGAIKLLNQSGDLSAWMSSMSDVVSSVLNYGMDEVVLQLEKLEKLGTALFSQAKGRRDRTALETLDTRSYKEWNRAAADAVAALRSSIVAEGSLRPLVQEIIKQCGDKWCLYSHKKKNGKHRRLGTHPSKEAAYAQERAIKAHGG
jgi:hypothetical protein